MAGSKTEAGLKPDNSLNKIINQFLNADNSNEQSTGQEVHSIFDVIKFLNSSDGKKLINEIAAKIFEEETTKERAQAEQRNEERLINQIKMAFLLYFLEERADAAQKMNELVEKQNTQAIQQAKGPSTDLNQPINNESKPSELNSLMEDNEKLLEEKKGLEEKGKKIDSKYSAMSEGLQNVQADDKNLSDDDIRKKIKELDSQLDAEMAKMDQMDEEGDYSASMNKINSLNLQAGAYRDMLDVREGTKYYADENGKKIDSAENAKFILKDDEQIVKRGDKTYLLNKKDDFDSLSPEDQEKAAQNYQRSKDQVLLLKDKVQQDESAEKSDYQSEVNTNAAAISAVGSRMSALKVPQAYIAPSSPSPMVQSDPAASRPPDPQPVSPTPVNSGPEPEPGSPDPEPGEPTPVSSGPEPEPGSPDPEPGEPTPVSSGPEPEPGSPDPEPGEPTPVSSGPKPEPGNADPEPGEPTPVTSGPESEPGSPNPEPKSSAPLSPMPSTVTPQSLQQGVNSGASQSLPTKASVQSSPAPEPKAAAPEPPKPTAPTPTP